MADATGAPSAEDRARYETLRKELMQALPRKRVTDKQLVRTILLPCVWLIVNGFCQ